MIKIAMSGLPPVRSISTFRQSNLASLKLFQDWLIRQTQTQIISRIVQDNNIFPHRYLEEIQNLTNLCYFCPQLHSLGLASLLRCHHQVCKACLQESQTTTVQIICQIFNLQMVWKEWAITETIEKKRE